MSGDANVGSIDAVREFRAALNTFLHESRDALITYDLESRRALEWLLDTCPKMWALEKRKCEEKITELNIAWQACRAQKLPGGGQPACLEEKKLLDRAKARMVYILDKIQKTRKWGLAADRQAIEYKGRSTHLMGVLDGDLPNALALLDRVLNSLEAYISFVHTGASESRENTGAESASVASTPADEKDKSTAAAGEKNGPAKAKQPGEGQPPGAEAALAGSPAAETTAKQQAQSAAPSAAHSTAQSGSGAGAESGAASARGEAENAS